MTYKLIALDLDGTLVNSERKITPKTRDALIEAQKQGAIVVLASGRPTSGLKYEKETLHLEDYHGILLSYNGGSVIDVTSGEVLYEKSMPNALAKELLVHLENFTVTPIIDDGSTIYTNTPEGFQIPYESKNNNLGIKVVERIADAIEFNPIKILIAAPNEILVPQMEPIAEPFKEQLSFMLSAPFYYEATMKGIDKAQSLRLICEKLGIQPSEVMAFGDAENDVSMISFAGLGVAMDNARPVLKEVADEVTLSNNEDGIAHTLAKYFTGITL